MMPLTIRAGQANGSSVGLDFRSPDRLARGRGVPRRFLLMNLRFAVAGDRDEGRVAGTAASGNAEKPDGHGTEIPCSRTPDKREAASSSGRSGRYGRDSRRDGAAFTLGGAVVAGGFNEP